MWLKCMKTCICFHCTPFNIFFLFKGGEREGWKKDHKYHIFMTHLGIFHVIFVLHNLYCHKLAWACMHMESTAYWLEKEHWNIEQVKIYGQYLFLWDFFYFSSPATSTIFVTNFPYISKTLIFNQGKSFSAICVS